MWNSLEAPVGAQYAWDPSSTYVHDPPFFKTMTKDPPGVRSVKDAFCLLNFGDSITTDHISPAGNINKESPAAKYLLDRGVGRKDFNSYGSRRGNDEIMARGTFANIRIVNKFLKGEVGPKTLHVPTQEKMFIYDAAMVRGAFSTRVLTPPERKLHSYCDDECGRLGDAEIQGRGSRHDHPSGSRVRQWKFSRLGCQGPLLAGKSLDVGSM